MKKLFVFILMLSCSIIARADICGDLRVELSDAVKMVPSPGGQLFVALPDGKTCEISVGLFEVSQAIPLVDGSPLKAWSISKTFTHVAILKLVEAGKLSLDQTLESFEMAYPDLYQGFLSSYPSSNQITLRHLLSHTSGIIDYMTLPEFFNNWDQHLTPGEFILTASRHQDGIAPGTRSRYSNTSMMILSRIVESATGMSIESFIRLKFFDSLGLTSTYIARDSEGWGPVHGYGVDAKGDFIDVTQKVSPAMAWGTGSIVSTAADLTKWFDAVLNAKVLSADITKEVFKPVLLSDGTEAEFGLGFRIQRFANGFVLMGHGGGPLEGNSATMLYSPQFKTTIVAMANGASENSNAILGAIGWKRVADYLQGKN